MAINNRKDVAWLNAIDPKQEIVNLFMDYETFGEHQWADTGIFEFMRYLPKSVFAHSNYQFVTPSEAIEQLDPVAPIHVPYPISWADEERDLTAWLGNDLQDDAFNNLYQLYPKVIQCNDPQIQRDWLYLQTSDHFYYMCTKWFSDGDVHKYFNHYDTPYEAYINYMNVLSDFELRLNESVGSETVTVKTKETTTSKFKPSIIIQPGTELIYPENFGVEEEEKPKKRKTTSKKASTKKTAEKSKTKKAKATSKKENKKESKKAKK
jgi:alpha-amylase